MNNKKEKNSGGGVNPGNLNIGIPSSISPKNEKKDNSFRTETDPEDVNGEAVIIDDQNIKLNSPNLSS